MILLWLLAAIELGSFPLLGAGTQTIGGYNILTVEGCLFGVMTFGIVMTMRVRFVKSLMLFLLLAYLVLTALKRSLENYIAQVVVPTMLIVFYQLW